MKQNKDAKVAFRTNEETVTKIEELVGTTKGGRILKTKTDVINYALLDFLEDPGSIRITLPENLECQLEMLKELGDVSNISEAVTDAVRDYVSQRIETVKDQNFLLSEFVIQQDHTAKVKAQYDTL